MLVWPTLDLRVSRDQISYLILYQRPSMPQPMLFHLYRQPLAHTCVCHCGRQLSADAPLCHALYDECVLCFFGAKLRVYLFSFLITVSSHYLLFTSGLTGFTAN